MGVIYLIVGIDPGLNVGYAALDLSGKLVGAGVVRNKKPDEIVGIVASLGVPLLIACDVREAPSFVRTIARRFNVRVFTPSKNLTQETKRIMAKDIFDHHIRDAYAAAVKAYRKYANRFRRIDSVYPDKSEYYKKLVLQGKAVGKIAKI